MLVKLCMEQFRRLPALSKQGYRFLILGVIATFIINMVSDTLGTVALLLTLLSAIMYRDPERSVPAQQEKLIFSPVDGVVTAISQVERGEAVGLAPGRYHVISVWQCLIDTHALRSPFSGSYQVATIEPNNSDSLDNANLLLSFTSATQSLAVLLPYSHIFTPMNLPVGTKSTMAGSKIAWLKFGGAIECYVPADHKLSIRQGQRLVAGETALN